MKRCASPTMPHDPAEEAAERALPVHPHLRPAVAAEIRRARREAFREAAKIHGDSGCYQAGHMDAETVQHAIEALASEDTDGKA